MADIYSLNRRFWDFAFENTGKIKPNHIAVYQFAIEHCNRLGWKKQFGFPTSMVLDAVGIKSYSVYKTTFDDLVEFGFFEVIEYSKNQYSSNVIALKENNKANTKALDKAFIKHTSKQCESTHQSIDSIDRQLNNNTNIQVDNDYFLVNGKIEKGNVVDWYLKNHQPNYEAILMQLQLSKFDLQIKEKLREYFINGFSFNDYKHIANSFKKHISENQKIFIPQKIKRVF
jgi:hypothetical protein